MPEDAFMAHRFEQFAAQRRQTGNIALSPDASEVAYIVDTSGQFNVWRQPIHGGWPHQLTLFEDWAARAIAWSPAGDTLCVVADKDGAERYQLFLVPRSGGSSRMITDRMDVQYQIASGAFSPNGRRLAFSGNELIPENSDVFLYDLSSGQKTVLVEGLGLTLPVSWSPDGRYLTVLDFRTVMETNVYIVDVASGERRLMTEHTEEAFSYPGPWSADSSGFYLLSNIQREYRALAFCSLETDLRWVETPDWDVETVALSADASLVAWSVNQDGSSHVHARDLASGDELAVPALPAGALVDLAVTPQADRLVVQLNCATRGTEIFAVDLDRDHVEQITFGQLGGLPDEAFVQPENVNFTSFDGRVIPALLYRPRTTATGRIPAILSIHGGPDSQERPEWRYSGLYHYLAYRGVAVLAPNVRGSTGYGKSYQSLNTHDWGGADLLDMEAAAKYLQAQDWVDVGRLGVFGASYGGFATLSCVTRLPQYWAAAVELVGPSNLLTFVESVPPMWRRFMDTWVGNPETEREFLLERSPISYVDQIRCPLLVMQGANDFRVVRAESDQMVERIRGRGGVVDYVVFENEGHGFTRRENEVKAYRMAAEFFLAVFGSSNVVPEAQSSNLSAGTS